tara:strand:- start:783 stop:1106 length:324 start_codon:yes stop_codon:yes gene_type:complete
MGLTQNNDLVNLLANFNKLKSEVDLLAEKINAEKILELDDENWENIRKKRNYLLKSSDWTMTPGSTVDQSQWSAYRQNLRDLPQKYKNKSLKTIVWPTIPSTDGPNT